MKIQITSLKKSLGTQKSKIILLYGNDTTAMEYIQTLIIQQRLPKEYEKIFLPQEELLASIPEILTRVLTYDMFAPQKTYFLSIQGANDQLMKALPDFEKLDSVVLCVEAFHLPVAAKIIQWAIQAENVLAVPLYEGSYSLEEINPLNLTGIQQKLVREICQEIQEPLSHFYHKLGLFIFPKTTVSEEEFSTFISFYPAAHPHQSAYIREYVERADASPIGLSRMLFAHYYTQLKSTKGKKLSFSSSPPYFSQCSEAPLKKHIQILEAFIHTEMIARQHAGVKVSLGFFPLMIEKGFQKFP